MQQSPLYQEWQQEAELRGREQGRVEERQTLALKMLQENLPLEMVARLTEFSIAELEALQSQLQQ